MVVQVVALQAQAQTGDPDQTGGVPQQGRHLVARQTIGTARVVMQELQSLPIDNPPDADTAVATDPHLPARCLDEGCNSALASRRPGIAGRQHLYTPLPRIQNLQAPLLRTDPDAAVRGLGQCLHRHAGKAVADLGRRAGEYRFETVASMPAHDKALPGAHPQMPLAVHQQRQHPVIGQLTGPRATREHAAHAGARVEALQPAPDAAAPDHAVGIFGQRPDGRHRPMHGIGGSADGRRAGRGDLVGTRVIHHQPVRFGADPDPTVAGRQQRADPAQIAQPRVGAFALLRPEAVAVVTHQAIAGGHPEEAGPILGDGRDDSTRNGAYTDRDETRLGQGVMRRAIRQHCGHAAAHQQYLQDERTPGSNRHPAHGRPGCGIAPSVSDAVAAARRCGPAKPMAPAGARPMPYTWCPFSKGIA